MAESTKPKPSQGRYDLAGARAPAAGLGRPPASLNSRTGIVAVQDPWSPDERIVATVNRRVDILEDERAHGRISEAAYQVGRIAQAIFERVRGPGGSNWQGGSRVDAWLAHELAVIHSLENARELGGYLDWLRRTLGMIDARLVARVLRDRMSYGECATLQGKSGERGVSYIAVRFRDALESLAEAKAAHGRMSKRSLDPTGET